MLTSKKILITGSAGFIGFHLVRRLISTNKYQIVGIDNINEYYNIQLKYARLNEIGIKKENIKLNQVVKSSMFSNYEFIQLDITDKEKISKLFSNEKFDYVVNLAAQAGVRYSIENPHAYIESNIVGFLNILEGCRHNHIRHLVYASSSSVYGNNIKMPLSTFDNVDHPISLYAATKKSNELMAHTYSHLYGFPSTGLRFFTVYGEWGRPDMAYFNFTKAIINNEPLFVFNEGNMLRDFTYIDDVIEGIIRVIEKQPKAIDLSSYNLSLNPSFSTTAPYKVYNIGNSSPVKLLDFIKAIEKALGKKANMKMMPMQLGDLLNTHSDVSDLMNDFGYKPDTALEYGVKKFVEWYLSIDYNNVS